MGRDVLTRGLSTRSESRRLMGASESVCTDKGACATACCCLIERAPIVPELNVFSSGTLGSGPMQLRSPASAGTVRDTYPSALGGPPLQRHPSLLTDSDSGSDEEDVEMGVREQGF